MDTPSLQSNQQLCQSKDNNLGPAGVNPNLVLPPEVLGTIFTHACAELDQRTPNFNAAHTIAQVCAHWRNITHHLPTLWTSIILSSEDGLWPLEKAKMYLDRSQSSLLRLNIKTINHYHHFREKIDAFEALCQLVIPHLHRCRSISIIEYYPQETLIIQKIMGELHGCHLPHLENLVVQAECQRRSGPEQEGPFTLVSPALVELRVSGPAIDIFVPHLSLDFITALHLSRGPGSNDSRNFLQILAACPTLHTLAIYDDVVDHWPGDGTAGAGALLMPELKVLQFYGLVTWISQFLLWIGTRELDALSVLPLSGGDLRRLESANVPNRFITKLTLSAFEETDIVALKMAAFCFPAIQHLILLGDLSSPEASSAFVDDAGFPLWPELNTISMREVSELKEQLLRSIVAHRKERGLPLTKVCVDAASIRTMKELSWLNSEVLVEVYDDWQAQQESVMYAAESESRFVNPFRS